MKDFDREKTLTELEKEDWGEPGYDSHLVTECHKLRKKPLNTFSIEDLRIMIGQQISLDYLVPIALEYLHENPLVQGDFYPGDLLNSIIQINYSFWGKNLDLKRRLDLIIHETLPVPKELDEALNSYLEAFQSIHVCSKTPKMDHCKYQILRFIENWYLSVTNTANEQAVYDGEAEEVNEIMDFHLYQINYCPFCGLELKRN